MNCSSIIVIASISIVFYLNYVTAQVNVNIDGGGGGGGGGDQAPGGRGGDINTKIIIKGGGRGGGRGGRRGGRRGGGRGVQGRLNNQGRRRGVQNIGGRGRVQVGGRGKVGGKRQVGGRRQVGGQGLGGLLIRGLRRQVRRLLRNPVGPRVRRF